MQKEEQEFKTIDEYIAAFPEDVQKKLRELRAVIHSAAPGAAEQISYQMPTFTLNGVLVYFAAWKNHISLYPAPVGVEDFQEDLSRYKTSKGTVQFPLDKPLPLDLVRRIVEYRMKQNLEKPAGKEL
ncbi:MAG: iron chaperone [Anaerolineaceae bacterium]